MQQEKLNTVRVTRTTHSQVQSPCLVDARNKLVRDDLAILRPVLPILFRAPFKVSRATMHEYDEEEDTVEVGNR